MRSWCLYLACIFVYSKESFPNPKYPHGNRTAVILSGQLRSGNITFSSKLLYSHENQKYFSDDDPRTPIQTQLEYLFTPLALFGGVDLFMYIPTTCDQSELQIQTHGSNRTKLWDGDPLTYKPSPGDTRPCELYSNHPIFHKDTGNRVFCMIECSKQLMDLFIRSRSDWKRFCNNNPHAREPFLQQEYGKYRGNLAAKEYAAFLNEEYKYKIRLRPDEAMISSFPSPDFFQFIGYNTNQCQMRKCIYYPSFKIYGFSAQDSFNFGESKDMDLVLDRYIDLLTNPIIFQGDMWISEHNLHDTIEKRYGLCLSEHFNITMTKLRVRNHDFSLNIPKSESRWIYMEPKE